MVGQGSGDADSGAGGRAGGGRGARAQMQECPETIREATGGKTTKASVPTPGTGTKRADGRPTEH